MSASPLTLVRPELRAFAGYSSARLETPDASVEEQSWLNANESPWRSVADAAGATRRYPDPQPARLRAALAGLYGCRPEQLLAGRGSDEAIDLIVRALCRPGGDSAVITTPTFGMYSVSAYLNGTEVIDVPQRDTGVAWEVDFEGVAQTAISRDARVVFLASPGNPSGTLLPLHELRRLAERLVDQALVVVDEAYVEFADEPSAITLLADLPNVAVLRTLSKAHALAGARVGAVIAHPDLINVLQRCQAPYPLPVPSVELACAALAPESLEATRAQIAAAIAGRARLAAMLDACPAVTRVYDSDANFVLARFRDVGEALKLLQAAHVVARDLRDRPGLEDALRISVGTGADLDRVEDALTRLAGAGLTSPMTRKAAE